MNTRPQTSIGYQNRSTDYKIGPVHPVRSTRFGAPRTTFHQLLRARRIAQLAADGQLLHVKSEALKLLLPLGPGATPTNGSNRLLPKQAFHSCPGLGFPGPTASDGQDLSEPESAPGQPVLRLFSILSGYLNLNLAARGRTASCQPHCFIETRRYTPPTGLRSACRSRCQLPRPRLPTPRADSVAGPLRCHWKQPAGSCRSP